MAGKPLFVQTLQSTLQAFQTSPTYLYRRNYNLLSDKNTSNYDIKYYFCCDTRYTCYNYPFIQLSRDNIDYRDIFRTTIMIVFFLLSSCTNYKFTPDKMARAL